MVTHSHICLSYQRLPSFLEAFIDMPELIAYMRQNYITWKELDEQGYTTLTDIGKLQASNLLSPLISKKRTNK